MNGAALGWSIFGACMVVGLLLTRPFYGRIRAAIIDDNAKAGYPHPVRTAHKDDHASIVALTIFACVLWPLGLPLIFGLPALIRYAGGTKYKSKYEREQETKALQNKIKELERADLEWRDRH